jgi:hypothetical protein
VLRTWVAAPLGLPMSWDRMKAMPAVDHDTAAVLLFDLCISAGPTLYAAALGCNAADDSRWRMHPLPASLHCTWTWVRPLSETAYCPSNTLTVPTDVTYVTATNMLSQMAPGCDNALPVIPIWQVITPLISSLEMHASSAWHCSQRPGLLPLLVDVVAGGWDILVLEAIGAPNQPAP